MECVVEILRKKVLDGDTLTEINIYIYYATYENIV